ncbi:acyl-CoA N-acyltransferase [Sporormia fimetaria CBS 119925]|uniref:Acyl-CoA N-acyltransferase n=1 Tax=Sporormia fimetaria CBS 119925 TaxID=1340428 RepID=A0A6A6V0E9_9PLEO|nr:acyl-CoA N-acyltransferase [Sporormia fimetaria CBS 119925]
MSSITVRDNPENDTVEIRFSDEPTDGPSEPYIRSYNNTRDNAFGPLDAFDCEYIFRQTSRAGPELHRLGSILWCHAYLQLCPKSCYVLENQYGTAVGYIIGTSDTSVMAHVMRTDLVDMLSDRFTQVKTDDPPEVVALKGSIVTGDCSMLLRKPDLLAQYPAHLHINLLPEYRKKGWGAKLMKVFLEKVKRLGARGVHLGMHAENTNAKRFYERLGFRQCEEELDGGLSGEMGRIRNAICMLKKLD